MPAQPNQNFAFNAIVAETIKYSNRTIWLALAREVVLHVNPTLLISTSFTHTKKQKECLK